MDILFKDKESYTEVRDPVYGFIKIPKAYLDIIDSKIFQRLRWISQIPLEQLVYPSAQHSRLEHSFGTMHLALYAANALLKNDKEKLSKLFNEDKDFKKLQSIDNKVEQFLLSAGLVGLLHDIGHAPYSHTLEDAVGYLESDEVHYDHEEVGYQIIKLTFSEEFDKQVYFNKTLRVLHKEEKHLTPIELILRSIVDGFIDVDKGDYLLRDSYHCGVSHGLYDYERLWSNVVITDDFKIGVKEKAAIEIWRMRFARFGMFKYVYKHHTRNITDALLIDIIKRSIKKMENIQQIMPFSHSKAIKKEEIENFILWTDTILLHEMLSLKDAEINEKINNFMSRKLHKRGFTLEIEFADAEEAKRLKKSIDSVIAKTKESVDIAVCSDISYLIEEKVLPPVQAKGISKNRLIKTKEGFKSIGEYFHFSVNEDHRLCYLLHIFVPMECLLYKEMIEKIKKMIEMELHPDSLFCIKH